MAVSLSPLFNPDTAQINANGAPIANGGIFTFVAGTTTKAPTFRQSDGTNPHENPIRLNANGLPPDAIYLTTGIRYKFVLVLPNYNDPPTSSILTIDNISGIGDLGASLQTEWIPAGAAPTFISASSFSFAGDQTSVLHPGMRIRATTGAGTVYGEIIRSVFGSPITTVTVLLDSGALDAGLSAISVGIISARNTSAPFVSPEQQALRLVMPTSTLIRLDPLNGNTAWVFQSGFWVRRKTPSAGVSGGVTGVFVNGVAGQALLVSTSYLICLFDNAGVLTLDFRTTLTTSTDALTGLLVMSGDASRLVVGLAVTEATGPTFKFVSSYYGSVITTQKFTASGTWVKPPGCTAALVRIVGSGGGGGGTVAASGAGNCSAGGGGSGGSYAEAFIENPSTTETVTIGLQGIAGPSGGGNGGPGGASSFGSLITAPGGLGGTGSGATTALGVLVAGGSSGALSSFFGVGFSTLGEPGGDSFHHATLQASSGKGGDTPMGAGGRRILLVATLSFQNGNAAGNFGGAGGSGGITLESGNATSGGAGAFGQCLITHFH